MHLNIFQNNVRLIQNYINKLERENIPITTQKVLIKTYANDLKINLTNKMILEILFYNPINPTIYSIPFKEYSKVI